MTIEVLGVDLGKTACSIVGRLDGAGGCGDQFIMADLPLSSGLPNTLSEMRLYRHG